MAYGRKTGGRKKGSVNRLSADAKAMLEQAAEGVGGLEALTAWGRSNPDGFWPLWAKLLPKNIETTGNSIEPLTVFIRREGPALPPQSRTLSGWK